MSLSKIFTLCAVLITLSSAQLSADTLKLKSGATHEGTLVSQNADEVKFEIGKNVKRLRTFKRADIESLTVVPPDEVALPPVLALLPTEDGLDAIDYNRLIRGSPEHFLNSFPKSKHIDEVKKVITTLKSELAKVESGAIKLGGEWVTRKQIEADPYNHEARLKLVEIKTSVEEENYVKAFRNFDALEQTHADSTSYPEAVEMIRTLLPTYSADLKTQLVKSTAENKQRETNYASMPRAERTSTEAAFKKKLEPFLTQRAADQAAKIKWLEVHRWDLDSQRDALATAEKELKRLNKLDLAKLTSRAKAVQEASALAGEEKFIEAAEKLKSAGRFSSGSYAAELQLDIKSKASAAEAEARKAKAAADKLARQKEREAKAETAKKKAENITTPLPNPDPPKEEKKAVKAETKPERSDPEEDPSDDVAAEEPDSSGGISLPTILMILIPIMGVVTFLSLRAAKNNKVEDFVPNETEDEENKQ